MNEIKSNKPAATGTGMGIMMPAPKVFNTSQIKEGQKITIAKNEPIYLFFPMGVDVGTQLKGINKRGPLVVKDLDQAPDRAPPQAMHGHWVEISVKPKAKVGAKDNVDLVTTMFPGRHLGDTHFQFKIGDNIYYMVGR